MSDHLGHCNALAGFVDFSDGLMVDKPSGLTNVINMQLCSPIVPLTLAMYEKDDYND